MHVGEPYYGEPLRARQPQTADLVFHHVEDHVVGQPVPRRDRRQLAVLEAEQVAAVRSDPERVGPVVMQRGHEGVGQALALTPGDDPTIALDALQPASVGADPGALVRRRDDAHLVAAQTLGFAEAANDAACIADEPAATKPYCLVGDLDGTQRRTHNLR